MLIFKSIFPNSIRKFFFWMTRYFIVVADFIVPVAKGTTCFSMRGSLYNGNSKVLFEYLSDSYNGKIKPFWLSESDFVACSKKLKNRNLLSRYSIYGFWSFLRSEIVVLSHGFGDLGFYAQAAKHKKVLQLWHGVGIKSMGVIDRNFDKSSIDRFISSETRFYNQIIVSSDVDRYYTASYMGVDVRKVAVAGLPRNDLVFSAPKKTDKISKILYVPTFRDKADSHQSFLFPFDVDFNEVEIWALKNNVQFFLRPHPNDKGSVATAKILEDRNNNVFVNASPNRGADVVDLILASTAIVTDYSSTYIDGLLRDMPCLFVDFDRERYMKDRGFAYDYDLVTPGPKVRTWDDFRVGCEEMLAGAGNYADARRFVREMFFKYQDSSSCERVAKIIEQMAGE